VALRAFRCRKLALGTVLNAVARETDLHWDGLGAALVVRHLRVAAVARGHEVVAVTEDQARLVHRPQVQVTWRAL